MSSIPMARPRTPPPVPSSASSSSSSGAVVGVSGAAVPVGADVDRKSGGAGASEGAGAAGNVAGGFAKSHQLRWEAGGVNDIKGAEGSARRDLYKAAARAAGIARSGVKHSFSRAVKSLLQEAPASVDDAVLSNLRSLHPRAVADGGGESVASILRDREGRVVVLDSDDMVRCVSKRISNGSAPGPSGLTGELLEDLCGDPVCCSGVFAMVSAIINGRLPRPCRVLLLCSSLIPVQKRKGGVRPVAVGEVLWKLATALAMEKMGSAANAECLPSIQLGVGVAGGSVIALHAAQAALQCDAGNMVLLTDVRNAFNESSRKSIASALAEHEVTAPVWHVVCQAYGDVSSPLLVKNRAGLCAVIDSECGVRQGDTLASFLFAVQMQSVYARALAAGGSKVTAVAVLDDLTLVGPPEDVRRAFDSFEMGCRAIGLTVSREKCQAFWPHGAPSGDHSDLFSEVDIPISSRRWEGVLGSALGLDDAAIGEFVESAAARHDRLFNVLSVMDPQVALLLLRSCGLPRFGYLCRALPPRLVHSAARQFDARVVQTFRAISGISTEFWEANPFAAKRVQFGRGVGVGLRSYESTCHAAFLSAVAQSMHFLPTEMLKQWREGRSCSSGPCILDDACAALQEIGRQVDAAGVAKQQCLKAFAAVARAVGAAFGAAGVGILDAVRMAGEGDGGGPPPDDPPSQSLIDGVDEVAEAGVQTPWMRALAKQSSKYHAGLRLNARMRRDAAKSAAESKLEQVRPPYSSRGASAPVSSSSVVLSAAAAAPAAAGAEEGSLKDLQKRITAIVDMAGVGQLRADLKAAVGDELKGNSAQACQLRLLDAVQRKGACRWMHVVPSDWMLRLNGWQFQQALRLHFGAPLLGSARDKCVCSGRPLMEGLPSDHVLSCRELRSVTNARHDAVLHVVQRMAREVALSTRWKPVFKGRVMEKDEIPDLEVSGGDWLALLDVSVVHSSAPSVAGRVDAAVSERTAVKDAKYDRAVMMAGATSKVAFVVENHGAVSDEAHVFLEEVARRGAENTGERVTDICQRFRDMLAIAIQRGNAALVERAGQLTGIADLH